MPEIRLTPTTLERLATSREREEFFDPRYPNLVLRVTRAGGKSFLFRLPRTGSGRRPGKTLGRYPELRLEAALERYRAEAARVEAGRPEPEVQAQIRDLEAELSRLKRLSGEVLTFERLAEEYLERYAKPNKRSWRLDVGMLRHDPIPAWKGRPIDEIRRRDVSELIQKVAQRAPIQANLLLGVLHRMWTWAMSRDLAESNPVSGVPKPSRPRRRERVLDREEIRLFWAAFDRASGLARERFNPTYGDALRLLLLTGQRRIEVLSLAWSELEEGFAWWNLGQDRTKAERPHRVYLTPFARQILERRRQDPKAHETYVFASPHARRRGKPLDENGLTHVFSGIARDLVEAGLIAAPARAHDLRRTAATRMAELGVERRIVSRVLNHADASITARYDLYQYDAEVNDALTCWSELVEALSREPLPGAAPWPRRTRARASRRGADRSDAAGG